MKEFKTSKGEFLAVLLPDDAYDIDLINNELYFRSDFGDFKGVRKFRQLDIEGNYEIITLLSEATEEKVKEMVEELRVWDGYLYHDYLMIKNFKSYFIFKTALESVNSLMQANEIFSKNPLGKGPKCGCMGHSGNCNGCDEFEQAQENTGNWLILKK